MKKTLFNRFYTGVSRGITTKTLPEHILVVHNNIYVRIFRVIGGICLILLLTKKLEYLGDGRIYIISVYSCIFFSALLYAYILYINYHRVIHIYKLLKSEDFEVRNSPRD